MALTTQEAAFVQAVSSRTGLDPRVLVAWIQSEGHPGDSAYNYLNIAAPTARSLGVPTVGTLAANTAAFGSLSAGVTATVKEIQSLGLGNLRGKTPQQAIAAIASTNWASSHYGGPGGPNLANTFTSIFSRAGLTSSYQGPATALAVASTAGTGSAADWTSYDAGNAAHDAATAAKDATDSLTGWVGELTGWIMKESKLALAYVLLVGVAGALLVSGMRGLGAPVPRLRGAVA